MKARRVLLLALAFSLLGSSVIFADSITQKIKLMINGQEVNDGAVMVDGKNYISVNQVSDALHAFVEWDSDAKKVTINKPNVNMLTALLNDSGKSDVFAGLKKGDTKGETKFFVICSVDNLMFSADTVKLVLTDPSGKAKDIQELDFKEKKETFAFQTPPIAYDFKSLGKYTLGFYIKPSKQDYILISENIITITK